MLKFLIMIYGLGLCAMITGCSPYIKMHDLGDDSIQEYIKPARFLESGFVDRVKCPTKALKYSETHKQKICRGTADENATLAWQVSVDEKAESYATTLVASAMHGMWFVAAAGTLGATMPAPIVNQSVQANPYAGSAISTQYINGQVPSWLVKP